MLRYICFGFALFVACCINARVIEDEFYSALQNGDYEVADSILAEWNKVNPSDTELLVAKFNYYLNKSRCQVISITGDATENAEALVFQDSSGRVAGAIVPDIAWNDSLYNNAIEVIEKAISAYPDRLDLRFGEARAFMYRDMYDRFLTVLFDVIDKTAQSGHKWLWMGNEPVDSREVADSMFDYCSELYNSFALDEMKQLCHKYTDTIGPEVKILNILGATYFIENNYSEALKAFELATKSDPNDGLVLCNMAYLYLNMGNKEKAAELCRQVINNVNCDDESRDIATNMLSDYNL